MQPTESSERTSRIPLSVAPPCVEQWVFLPAPSQISVPATMNINAGLGFSCVGHGSASIASGVCDGRRDLLLRLKGTSRAVLKPHGAGRLSGEKLASASPARKLPILLSPQFIRSEKTVGRKAETCFCGHVRALGRRGILLPGITGIPVARLRRIGIGRETARIIQPSRPCLNWRLLLRSCASAVICLRLARPRRRKIPTRMISRQIPAIFHRPTFECDPPLRLAVAPRDHAGPLGRSRLPLFRISTRACRAFPNLFWTLPQVEAC